MTDEQMSSGTLNGAAHRADPGELTAMAAMAAELGRLRAELEQQRLEAVEASRRHAVMLSELQRRIRNTSALVRSVFERTMETGESLEDVESHFSGRLSVLTRYEMPIMFGATDRVDLQCLIRDEFQEFTFEETNGITIDGPDVHLPPSQVQALALAIHELVTNALKYGALAIDKATLRVTWTLTTDHIELVWAESGVPVISSAPLRSGFGREFLEEALPYQVGAATSFELRPGGVLCCISLPLITPNTRTDSFA